LARWTILVSNVPRELLSVTEAMELTRLRWQIELVFKGQVPQPPERLKRHAMATATTFETAVPGTCSVFHNSVGA
jgi:hypothetical protein